MTVRNIFTSLSVGDPGTKLMVPLAAGDHWIGEGVVLLLLIL